MSKSPTAKELSQKCYDPEWFRLIPGEAIYHKTFTDQPEYAASWDLFVNSEGRIFFPLCAEIYDASIVRLYEYIPENDEFRLCFRLEDVTFQHDDMIRASKIHTSLAELPDGRLIMTTHTTARSPRHPDWMPQAYYGHPWEGYRGSHILIYDLKTGKVENRGIPVPEESIYGARYDKKHNCLYFTGYIRGHLYRYDLDTNALRDYGKITEYGTYCICEGPDGNFYSASRSGNMFRINTTTQEIEEIGIELPDNNGEASHNHRIISYGVSAKGKLYLQPTFSNGLWAYDPAVNELSYVGDFRPKIGGYEPDTDKDIYTQWIFGLAFDDEDCLWYGYSFAGLHLMRWDIFNGGEPENMGVIGSVERCANIAAEILYQDGKLYIGDTNHLLDGPGVAVVDIKKLMAARAAGVKGEICQDAFVYLEAARGLESEKFAFRPVDGFEPISMDSFRPELEAGIQKYLDDEKKVSRFMMKDNPFSIQVKTMEAALLWRSIGMERSSVQNLRWADNGTLIAQTGTAEGNKWEVKLDTKGNVLDLREIDAFEVTEIPERLKGLSYPNYPGRQYKAVPNAWTPWKDGAALVGTQDGMLALVREDGSVYGLGSTCTNGPIHCLFTAADGSAAYGVAGHDMDLGNIFSYDDRNGLRCLGAIYQEDLSFGMAMASNRLSSIALSPDGKTLAVGGRDRMGCVYFLTF